MKFENDYIMRMIHEMIRMLVKLLFNVDTESPIEELAVDSGQKDRLEHWYRMIDDGQINEAENQLSDLLEEGDSDSVRAAILFYSYLNRKSDAFLEKNHYSREEIQAGLEDIAVQCGIGGLAEIFVSDER